MYSKVSMITENPYISFHTVFYLVDAYLDAATISHYLSYNLNEWSSTNKNYGANQVEIAL